MKPMEDDLQRPLKQSLALMQRRIVEESTYFGIRTMKSPTDFWVYQEILHRHRPDVVIEIGNLRGGSALAIAHLLDHLGAGRVIAIDIDQSSIAPAARAHPRIEFIESDAASAATQVSRKLGTAEKVMVIEDSSHAYEQTLAVLEAYGPMVTKGQYLVVEDSICHHGVDQGPAPGPYEAIATFVASHPEFRADRSREAFGITWNPMGYLLRS